MAQLERGLIEGLSYERRFALARAGEPKPPLVCLHGIGGGVESFRPQIEGLKSDNRDLIAWCMPGYGQSLPGELSFEALRQVLSKLLKGLGYDRASFLGHSIGGMVALDFSLHYPEKTEALVLVGTVPRFGGKSPDFAQAFLSQRLKPLDQGMTMADLAEAALPNLVGSKCEEATKHAISHDLSLVPEQSWRHILTCLVLFDREDEVRKIQVPTLVLAGLEDKSAPAKSQRKMANLIPRAEFHAFEGVGHFPHQEEASRANALIEAFLRRLAP